MKRDGVQSHLDSACPSPPTATYTTPHAIITDINACVGVERGGDEAAETVCFSIRGYPSATCCLRGSAGLRVVDPDTLANTHRPKLNQLSLQPSPKCKKLNPLYQT